MGTDSGLTWGGRCGRTEGGSSEDGGEGSHGDLHGTRGRGYRRACAVSGSWAGMLRSSGRPFIGSQGSRASAPPPDWGSFHSRHQILAAVTNENTQMEKKTEIIFASMTLPLTTLQSRMTYQQPLWPSTPPSMHPQICLPKQALPR